MTPVLRIAALPLLAALTMVAYLPGPAASETAGGLHRERIEWCDIWITDAAGSDRPRVLFIGDSIVRGYFGPAEAAIGDNAVCARYTTSRSVCDPVFFDELELVLKQYDFAVIHFNNGLHGWAYTEEEYRDGMERFVAALKMQAPDAKLMWAATTPVREDSSMGDQAVRVADRNAIATTIMKEAGIPADDLYTLIKDNPDYLGGDGVHFTPEGREAQGVQAADHVLELLHGETAE